MRLNNEIVGLHFSYEGERVFISTQERVKAEDWDTSRQRPRSSKRGRQDLVQLAARLQKWELAVTQTFAKVGRELTRDEFRQEVLYAAGAEERPGEAPKQFLPYLENFIAQKKRIPGNNRHHWGKYEGLLTHLKEFAEETNYPIDFKTINWDFRDNFLNWMYEVPRSFSINNAEKYLNVLRTVLKDANRRGASSNKIYEDTSFGIRRVKTKNKVRLTVEELKRIEQHHFADETQDQVRDMLLFGCWTGLRISDWHKIGRANFRKLKDGYHIEVATTKTKTPVLIPVTALVRRILEKYEYDLPKMSDQYFNRVLKEVCKAAIPESRFTRIYSKGGQRLEEQAYKWEYVTSHAGRRSFASNLYEKTGVAYPIMQITGHDTESSFFKYIDLKREENAAAIGPALRALAGE